MNRQTRDTLGRTCLSTGVRQSQSLAAVIVSCSLQGISRLRNTVAARAVRCIGMGIGSASLHPTHTHRLCSAARSPCARPVDLDTVSALSPATHWRGTHITLPCPAKPTRCSPFVLLCLAPSSSFPLSYSYSYSQPYYIHTYIHQLYPAPCYYYTKCSSRHIATYYYCLLLKKPPWIPSLARPLLLSCTTSVNPCLELFCIPRIAFDLREPLLRPFSVRSRHRPQHGQALYWVSVQSLFSPHVADL